MRLLSRILALLGLASDARARDKADAAARRRSLEAAERAHAAHVQAVAEAERLRAIQRGDEDA